MTEEIRFEIGNKAEKLYFSVFDMTTSRQHYPVKYRRMADKLQETSLNIFEYLYDANSIKIDTAQHKEKKFDLQTSTITECNKLLSMIRYSIHANLISVSVGEQWANLAHDIKFMTLAWRKT